MAERASLAELLEFANKVREAGGGNPIDALMPAVPEDPGQCLIAKNLNFNCVVNGSNLLNGGYWYMAVDDEAVRDRIAAALDLEIADDTGDSEDEDGGYKPLSFSLKLPGPIGQVASDFDEVMGVAYNVLEAVEDEEADKGRELTPEEIKEIFQTNDTISNEERALFIELIPYVEAASDEARRLASIVNDDGTIVV